MTRLALCLTVALAGCGHRGRDVTELADPSRGRDAVERYACGSCHLIPGIDGASGRVGPMLSRFREQAIIAGHLPNTMPNLVRWLRDPQSVSPGTAMPDLGITEPTARDIAAYLYTVR